MGTYRKEWECCNGVSETQAYEPDVCPFCTPDTVTITQAEHDKLWDAFMKLNALINAGVDNWEWYGEAMEEYRRSIGEDDE